MTVGCRCSLVPFWNGWLDPGGGYPPCFLVCVGKKGVTGGRLVCRGTKGLSTFCDGEQGLAGEFVALFEGRCLVTRDTCANCHSREYRLIIKFLILLCVQQLGRGCGRGAVAASFRKVLKRRPPRGARCAGLRRSGRPQPARVPHLRRSHVRGWGPSAHALG
jgi:hypothetical protein